MMLYSLVVIVQPYLPDVSSSFWLASLKLLLKTVNFDGLLLRFIDQDNVVIIESQQWTYILWYNLFSHGRLVCHAGL